MLAAASFFSENPAANKRPSRKRLPPRKQHLRHPDSKPAILSAFQGGKDLL